MEQTLTRRRFRAGMEAFMVLPCLEDSASARYTRSLPLAISRRYTSLTSSTAVRLQHRWCRAQTAIFTERQRLAALLGIIYTTFYNKPLSKSRGQVRTVGMGQTEQHQLPHRTRKMTLGRKRLG